MKTLINIVTIVLIFSGTSLLSSCTKEKAKELLWDSGLYENLAHGGTYAGKVRVYTIDWLDYTKTASDEEYRVYKKSNGDYVIDYDGESCILQKADEPFEGGIYTLKWKIDYNHYIEDVPKSW